MDAILFHPETSIRRALILALGTYGTEGLSPGEREPLIARLLDLYRNDPDAGIHGAAEWTLRQWKAEGEAQGARGRAEKLKDRRAALVRQQPGSDLRRDRGPGRVPHGLTADRAGPGRRNETPHACAIPRRFAIADKEVTVAQFQRFFKLGGMTTDRDQLPPELGQVQPRT